MERERCTANGTAVSHPGGKGLVEVTLPEHTPRTKYHDEVRSVIRVLYT